MVVGALETAFRQPSLGVEFVLRLWMDEGRHLLREVWCEAPANFGVAAFVAFDEVIDVGKGSGSTVSTIDISYSAVGLV